MGSYWIPNNKLKGEGRILYIFTPKSLITTAIGGGIGFGLYKIMVPLGLGKAGLVIIALLAIIGYGIVTLRIPENNGTKLSKNVGGDSIDEIVKKYLIFKRNKTIYSYAIPRKEPEYLAKMNAEELNKQIKENVKTNVNGIQKKENK